jgi:hypothetical protein
MFFGEEIGPGVEPPVVEKAPKELNFRGEFGVPNASGAQIRGRGGRQHG